MKDQFDSTRPANSGKFKEWNITADGSERAEVKLERPQTLWFNTGTLCNIECANCYILSSPKNDALVYLTADEVTNYLNQLRDRDWPVKEIAFTGGEPFMNPEMVEMARRSLDKGYEVLILTNAMAPMMRKSVRDKLSLLISDAGDRLTFRVSIDHWSEARHDAERGPSAFQKTLTGMRWLRDQGARMAVAGRSAWSENEASAREGFARLFADNDFKIDAQNPAMTVLFPEMDESVEVPEITTACWKILNKSPTDVMCSHSRMVVKRKGAAQPTVLACTLLAYDEAFELGATLEEAEAPVRLNHPHCAKFCVLGGASCSA